MAIPDGRIWLLSNVLLNNTYEHTFDFKSTDEQFAYWYSFKKYEFANARYTRKTRPSVIVDVNIDKLDEINYMIFQNNGRKYYAFVVEREWVSSSSSALYYEIDVMQTYMFDYEILPSYVLREHTDRWTLEHKPIYSLTDEELDYGNEYVNESAFKVDIHPELNRDDLNVNFFLVICKEHNNLISSGVSSEPTKIGGTPSPYTIYMVAHVDGYDLISFRYTVRGNDLTTNIPVGNWTLQDLMNYMGKSEFGNYVQQIVHIPYLPFLSTQTNISVENGVVYIEIISDFTEPYTELGTTLLTGVDNAITKIKTFEIGSNSFVRTLSTMSKETGIENAIPTDKQWTDIKVNPLTTERDKRFESKLLCYPYRYNMLTDFRNPPIIYKNEYIGGNEIKLNFSVGIGFNLPYRYWLDGYRNDPEGRENSFMQLQPLESVIISDAYYSYMLENKNQMSANITNAQWSSFATVGSSTLLGGAMGGAGGALASGFGSLIQGAVNVNNVRRSQNALKKDLKNIPDTILNSNDCSLALDDNNTYIHFYRKKITCEFENMLADTFAMNGYTCKRVKVPNIKSRMRFNYIQTIGANIKGAIPYNDLLKIKNVFDNGITFWHYSAEHFNPLDYTYENIERSLL